MRSETEIMERLKKTLSDDRMPPPVATVFANAPLAFIQTQLETEYQMLAWVLELDKKAFKAVKSMLNEPALSRSVFKRKKKK